LTIKRPTENELSDFSWLWHHRCGVAIIEAHHVHRNRVSRAFDDLNGPVAELGEGVIRVGAVVDAIGEKVATGFKLLPRRGVVERTLAWLSRNRRFAEDFEASIASAKAWVYIASVQLLIRRLAGPSLCNLGEHNITYTIRSKHLVLATFTSNVMY
jgi:transposase